jgi:CubicO group peptidase (beta-lactamase class C family)
MRTSSTRASLLVVALACSACAGTPAPAPAPPPASPTIVAASAAPSATAALSAPAPAVLSADTPEVTSSGTTFTAPAGWTLVLDGPRAMLTGPEPDLHLVVLDANAATAEEAVASAWTTLHQDFKRPLKTTTQHPGRHGFEEYRRFDYETSPNEKLVVFASARRHGGAWTVLLLEGSKSSVEKRLASMRRVDDSLRPKDYVPESFAGKTPHKLDAERAKTIVDTVERTRERATIPGVALALVQDGRVVYEGGLGVRDMGKPDKVDAHTRFLIASNTKAMTTLLLAKLVDEGKLTWETPVTQLYPGFKLGDDDTTRQVLVKHLICACTGLPRQDFEWLFQFEKATPKGEMDALVGMQPTTKFGEAFQYSNPLAAAAGFVGGYVLYPKKELGAAYDEAMQSRVFGPLGMTETTLDFGRALRSNHSAAHEFDVDGKIAMAVMDLNRSVVPIRPAGAAWSTVHDIAKYVSMELAGGKLPDGKRYISEEALLARRKPQVSVGEFATYGMGLMVDSEWGVPVVHHGGDMVGFHSDMFWIPEAGVGGVILTNGPGWLIRRAFLRKTLEVLYDGRAEAEDDASAAIAEAKAHMAAERPRLTLPPDPQSVATLATHYTSAALGDIVVSADGPARIFDFGGWKSPVASRKNDDGTVSMVTVAPGADGIAFVVDRRDGKRALVVRDMQHEYVFAEAAN